MKIGKPIACHLDLVFSLLFETEVKRKIVAEYFFLTAPKENNFKVFQMEKKGKAKKKENRTTIF